MLDLRNALSIDLVRCKGAYLEDAPDEIWDGTWMMEPKRDGIRSSLQIGVESKGLLVGKNRQDFLKGVDKAGPYRHLSELNPEMEDRASHKYLPNTMLDGELTEVFKQDGTYDKDTEKRIANGDFIGFETWGALTYLGHDCRIQEDDLRYRWAADICLLLDDPKIKLIDRVPATFENMERFFDMGIEGVVVKKAQAAIPAQRTNPNWWKVKGEDRRTVDAFVTDVTQSKEGGSGLTGVKPEFNGKAAGFEVSLFSQEAKQGLVKVGMLSALPKDVQEDGYKQFYPKYIDRVVEMKVSGWDGGEFRWCRFVKWRPDKNPDDCRLDEQIGKIRKE